MARRREETISDRQAAFLLNLGVPAGELPEGLGEASQLISAILFVRACARKRLGSSKCISKADAIRIASRLVGEDREDLEHFEQARFRGEDGAIRLKDIPADESKLAPWVYQVIDDCETCAPPESPPPRLSTSQWRTVAALLFVIICGVLYILLAAGCGGSGGDDPPEYHVGIVNGTQCCIFVEYRPKGQTAWLPWGGWSLPAGKARWKDIPRGTFEFTYAFYPASLGPYFERSISGDPEEPIEILLAAEGCPQRPNPRPDEAFTLRIGNRTRERIVPMLRMPRLGAGGPAWWLPISCEPVEHMAETEISLQEGSYWIRWDARGSEGWVESQEVLVSGDAGDTVVWVWS